MSNVFELKTVSYLSVDDKTTKILEKRFPGLVTKTAHGVILPDNIQKEVIYLGSKIIELLAEFKKVPTLPETNANSELEVYDKVRSIASIIDNSDSDAMKACKLDLLCMFCFADPVRSRTNVSMFTKYVKDNTLLENIVKKYFLSIPPL